jgi:shikimate dehydrogenase
LAFIQHLRAFVPTAVVSAADEPSGAFDVVINASPVGMNVDDPTAIPAPVVECAAAVVDIVAAPTTRLRELARARRKIVVAGHAMVRAQAQLLRRFICSGAASEADTIRAEGITGIPALAIP